MEAMYLLIAISLVFVVVIGAAFWWAIFAGQFDNSDSEGRSILADDDAEVRHNAAQPIGPDDEGASRQAAVGRTQRKD